MRGVTCREDQCRTRTRAAPQVLAALRNTVLTIIRRSGRKPVKDLVVSQFEMRVYWHDDPS